MANLEQFLSPNNPNQVLSRLDRLRLKRDQLVSACEPQNRIDLQDRIIELELLKYSPCKICNLPTSCEDKICGPCYYKHIYEEPKGFSDFSESNLNN